MSTLQLQPFLFFKTIPPSHFFKSSLTNKSYLIESKINCNSQNIIYKFSCKYCPLAYIGKTTYESEGPTPFQCCTQKQRQ